MRLDWRPHCLTYWAEHDVIGALSFTAKGLLVELFDRQWKSGHLPQDPEMIRRHVRATEAEWAELAPYLDLVFPVCHDGLRRNTDLALIRADQEQKVRVKRENGQKGGRPRKPDENPPGNQTETEPTAQPSRNLPVNLTETDRKATAPLEEDKEREEDLDKREPPLPPLNLVVNQSVSPHSEDGLPRYADGSLTRDGRALAEWDEHLRQLGRDPLSMQAKLNWLMRAGGKPDPGWLESVVKYSLSKNAKNLYEPPRNERYQAGEAHDSGREVFEAALAAAEKVMGGAS